MCMLLCSQSCRGMSLRECVRILCSSGTSACRFFGNMCGWENCQWPVFPLLAMMGCDSCCLFKDPVLSIALGEVFKAGEPARAAFFRCVLQQFFMLAGIVWVLYVRPRSGFSCHMERRQSNMLGSAVTTAEASFVQATQKHIVMFGVLCEPQRDVASKPRSKSDNWFKLIQTFCKYSSCVHCVLQFQIAACPTLVPLHRYSTHTLQNPSSVATSAGATFVRPPATDHVPVHVACTCIGTPLF